MRRACQALVLVAVLLAAAAARPAAAGERALPTLQRGSTTERWREVADESVKVRRD